MISLSDCNGFVRSRATWHWSDSLRSKPMSYLQHAIAEDTLKKWLHRWLFEPLMALLRAGLSPRQLALSIAIAIVVGNIPILGVSTILCALIALTLRLNLPAIQLVQAAMTPTQLVIDHSLSPAWRVDIGRSSAGRFCQDRTCSPLARSVASDCGVARRPYFMPCSRGR